MALFPYEGQPPSKDDPKRPRPVVTVGMVPDRFEVPDRPEVERKINVKAVIALVVAFVMIPVACIILANVQDGRLRRQALDLARESAEAGRIDLALTTMAGCLERWPDDIEALETMAQLRTDSARTLDEVLAAVEAQELVLRVDPLAPKRQDNRRDLIKLYIRWTEGLRQGSSRQGLSVDKYQGRARAAVKVAQQRLTFGAEDGEAHRLLAMALESLGASGDSTALAESTLEYEKALRRDPADVASAEHLARIIYDRGQDKTGPDEILDEMVQAAPTSVEARLARYRFFVKTSRFDRARAELAKATELAPADPNVRLTAASEALQVGDPVSARRHLEAIPAGQVDERRLAMFRGFIEVAESQPDVALDVWRKGLLASGGTDRELTWRMAYMMVQLGRFAEADPLIAQFRRLAGEGDPMYLFLKGLRDERIGRPSAAIAEMKSLAGSVGEAWAAELAMSLGRAYEAIRDDTQAMVEYRRAIKASPRMIEARRAFARLLKKDDPEGAAREIEAALALVPGESSLFLELALVRLQQQLALLPSNRTWPKVIEVLDRADRAGKPDPGLVQVRAEILNATGRPAEASSLLESALSGPGRKRDTLWLTWADSLTNRGRIDEALKALERASAPENAGDRASLRIARATLWLGLGKGRAAREQLTKGAEALPVSEQVELARSRSRALQLLGDKLGAREACKDWARLSPLDPWPGLALLDLSQRNGDDEAAKLGLDLLRGVGGEDEPYGLAARALDLLQSNRPMAETRTARLELAAGLSLKLSTLAPKLPVSHLVRAIVLERNHRVEDAITDYRVALQGETAGMALSRLTQLFTRLKRFDDLAALKEKVGSSIGIDRLAARLAIEQGDMDGAERVVSRLTEGSSDDLSAREAQARFLRQLGKPEAAEEALRAVLVRDRDRADAWLALVAFQVGQGHAGPAAETIERATTQYHGPRPDLLNARLRWVAGDLAAATRLFDEVMAQHPDDLATLQAVSDFAEATGRPERAEAITRKALGVPGGSAWAARRLATMLARRPGAAAWNEAWALVAPGGPGAGDSPNDRLLRASLLEVSPDPARRAEAIPALADLVEDLPASQPTAIRARVDLATLLFREGKPAEAAVAIAPATEESIATDSVTLSLSVEILARAGRPDEAESRLSRLAALSADATGLALSRAWIFQARGKSKEAVATVEDAAASAEKAPDGEAKQVRCLNQLIEMKQLEAAERLARKIARLWPKNATTLAEFLAARGRADEALDACQIAVDAGATAEPMKLALSLVISGRLAPPQGEKARAIADAVLAAKPGDAGLSQLAVLLASRQGRYEDALKAARRTVEADPSNLNSLNQLNDLAWILCEELARPADALVEVDRVLKASPLASAMDTRGVILTRLERYPEAIEQLERCVQKQPVGNRFLHLARAYQKAGKLEQYRGALDRAKKAGINPATLIPKEQAEFAAVLGR